MEEINIQNHNLPSEEQEYDIPSLRDEHCFGPSSFQLFDSNDLSAKGILSLQKKFDSTRFHTILEEDVPSDLSFDREENDQKHFANHSSKNCSAKDDFSECFETNQRQFEDQMESPNECKECRFLAELSKKIKKNENSLETKSSSTKKKNAYPVKNLLKIIGNSIISKIKSNTFLNKKILEQSSKMYGINPVIFTEWVDKENYYHTFINFQSFRDLFTDALHEEKDKNFKLVLRQLTLWFLENEIYSCFIFEKKIKVDVTLYLEKIPKILQGLKDPTHFYSLQ